MGRWNVVLGTVVVVIALAALGLVYKSTTRTDTVVLKDNSSITGHIVKQEFGKYVVVKKPDNTRQVVVWDQVKDLQLSEPPWYEGVSEAFESMLRFGVLGGFIIFAIGLWQYSQSQKWKRAEFLLSEIRKFEPNANVSNVRAMLDYEEINLFLFGKKAKSVKVDKRLLASALSNPNSREDANEMAIRRAFDNYLSYLDHFNNMIEAGLVKKQEMKLYLGYWLDIMGNTNNAKLTPEIRQSLWTYMQHNGFDGAVALLKKYGYQSSIKNSNSPEKGDHLKVRT